MTTSRGLSSVAARKRSGFSLFELMIVVAIVAIMSAVAYPSYLKSIQKSRRADALSTLVQTQVIFERCYAQNFSYVVSCSLLPTRAFASPQGYYTITPSRVTATAFLLTATPIPTGSQAGDTRCATISINETNDRIGKDANGTLQEECWNP